MSHIISPSRVIEDSPTYVHYFDWPNSRSGYAFDCDKDGNLNENPEYPTSEEVRKRYAECLSGMVTVDGIFDLNNQPVKKPIEDKGITEYLHHYRMPAVLQCDCGAKVELDDCMTNTCDKCNADYNGSGQRLAPRSQWGEETGESLSDIMMGGDPWSNW